MKKKCTAGGSHEAWQQKEYDAGNANKGSSFSEQRKNNESRYILALTPEQTMIVEQACELLARLHIGQFERITEMLLDFRRGMEDYCHRRDMANDLLRLAALTIFGRDNYNHPDIHAQSEEHKRAWMIYSVLRYTRSWHENPNGGYTVNFDKPMNLIGDEPMPRCVIRKETQDENDIGN